MVNNIQCVNRFLCPCKPKNQNPSLYMKVYCWIHIYRYVAPWRNTFKIRLLIYSTVQLPIKEHSPFKYLWLHLEIVNFLADVFLDSLILLKAFKLFISDHFWAYFLYQSVIVSLDVSEKSETIDCQCNPIYHKQKRCFFFKFLINLKVYFTFLQNDHH